MSADTILEAWQTRVPPLVPLDDVLLVVGAKFEEVSPPRRGSHYKLKDSRLKRFSELAPNYLTDCLNGVFTIPTVKGKSVKGHYVIRIIELIKIVDTMTAKGY